MNSNADWQKTNVTNLIRYVPKGTLYARVRVCGKLKRKSLKTTKISVAKLRLADFVKAELRKAGARARIGEGKMVFQDCLDTFVARLEGNAALKPRSKQYRHERIKALLKSWSGLAEKDVSKISKDDCLRWAGAYAEKTSPSNYNNTVDSLRLILKIAKEEGLIYDNPAEEIKKKKPKQKVLELPSYAQFQKLLGAVTEKKVRYSEYCAELIKFLAYGGFRLGEAVRICWADCDFEKKEILVRGDELTGTKNGLVRRVPMIPEMENLLSLMRQNRGIETASSLVMRVKKCQGALTSACRKESIKRMTHHDLRHLFATTCIENGVDIPTVSKWLGHKDGGALAMKTYGHLRGEHSRDMALKVSFSPKPLGPIHPTPA